MRVMAWVSLALGVTGLLLAPSPLFMALVMPEDSGWMQAGWAFLFVTVPAGLLLLGVSVVLTVILGIRGLAQQKSRLASILALLGAVGCALVSALLLVLVISGPATASALLLGLLTTSAMLFVVRIVAGFVASRSTAAATG